MGILKKLANSEKLIDASIKGIDNAFFTQEERAEAVSKITEAHASFVKSSLSGSTVSSVTRRYIAVSIMAVYLLLVLMSVVVYFFDPELSKFIQELLTGQLATMAIMVAAFYFGGYMMSSHILPGLKGKDKTKKSDK